ncbi:MAG: DUF1566 domain-containing protein [Betaproteobacteria bacterium]
MLRVDAEGSVLEGSGGSTSDLNFLVTLDKAVVSRLELRISTVSLIKPGFASSPGAAKGGASCGPDVDYLQQQDQPVVFAPGASSGYITIKVCHDTVFEPNETLNVTWKTVGGTNSTLKGLIINDDVGGLNGTGATATLAGLPAFGRDVNTLTKSDADGALGFSFDATTGSPACILDKVTGLLWQTTYTPSAYANMSNLVNAANNANVCGKSDWRVPGSNELLSVLNFSTLINQPMNADTILSAPRMTGDFWTAEEVANATDNAWVVSPGQGGAVTFFSKTASTPFVRLVSGGLDNGVPRAATCNDADSRFDVMKDATIAATPDGTIYDKKSGLMWKQCTEGSVGAQCSQTSSPPFVTASATSTYLANWLKNVNDNPSTLGAGFSDWRIPTVKELASLVDRCITPPSTPAINTTIFPASKSVAYISSTVNANDITSFWYVDFKDGTVAVGTPQSKYLRLVRAGQ